MSPHMSVMEGTFDEKSNELTMEFRDYDAMTGKLTDMKAVTSFAPGKPETGAISSVPCFMRRFEAIYGNFPWEFAVA